MPELRGARVLVTGGNGFVGKHLVARLHQMDAEVVCVHRSAGPCCSQARTCVSADLSAGVNSPLLDGVDAVVHLAAALDPSAPPATLLAANVGATLHLLEAAKAKQVSTFIFASTGGVYGYRNLAVRETARPRPLNLYSLTKYQAELLVGHYASSFAATTARLFFPYGPGQKTRFIPLLSERIRTGAPVSLVENGRHPLLNPVHVDDVCAAFLRMLQLRVPGTFNVAGWETATVRDIANRLGSLMGRLPLFESRKERGLRNMQGDIGQLSERLDFRPQVGLDDGLKTVLADRH